MDGFEELLKVTSALRREQEKAKLDERMAEQQSQLAMANEDIKKYHIN